MAVIGAGYVGLTTAVGFTRLGHEVMCVDIDAEKIAELKEGKMPHYEPGLSGLLKESLASGRLNFVTDVTLAVPGAKFIYLCLPTPMFPDGRPDISALLSVADEIGPIVAPEAIVVNKSTVPVGSHRVVREHLGRGDVPVVSNPEFLREGQAVKDFFHPDRVVVGAEDPDVALVVAELFKPLNCQVIITDPISAETIKYAANAFLATKLSFMNSLATMCEMVEADVDDVIVGVGSDPRIGSSFMRPGPGWGGSCFPKDVRALLHISEENGFDFSLLRSVIEENDKQFDRVAKKILEMIVEGNTENLNSKNNGLPLKVAVWGLTFKANTDDLRQSPAIEVIRRLESEVVMISAYDPVINPEKFFSAEPNLNIEIAEDPYAVCADADVLVVLTEWESFRNMDLAKVADLMRERNVFDARNVLDRRTLNALGFTVKTVGGRR